MEVKTEDLISLGCLVFRKKKTEELSKKPPIFKKLFASGSMEEALQILKKKKKKHERDENNRTIIARFKNKCRTLIKTGTGLWNMEKETPEAIYAQQEHGTS